MTAAQTELVARFFVAGRPRTKGHMKPQPHRRANGKLAITLHDRDDAREWLQTLIKGIREQIGIEPIIRQPAGNARPKVIGVKSPWPHEGPVSVDSTFYFDKRMSLAQSTYGMPWSTHSTPYPTAIDIGDADTLQRCVLDALTQSGLIVDDRMVVEERSRKRWIDEEQPRAGVLVEVRAA